MVVAPDVRVDGRVGELVVGRDRSGDGLLLLRLERGDAGVEARRVGALASASARSPAAIDRCADVSRPWATARSAARTPFAAAASNGGWLA